MYIYMDILVLVNIVANTLILFLTAWLLGIPYRKFRLAAAVAISVFYVFILLYCRIEFLNEPLAKFLVSVAIVGTAFPTRSWRQGILRLGAFYLISFVLGGAVLGYIYFMRSGEVTPNRAFDLGRIGFPLLLKGLLLGGGIVYFCARPLWRRKAKSVHLHRFEIVFQEKSVFLTGLLDSGNQLCSYSKAVVLVEKDAILPLLSDELKNFLNSVAAENWIAQISDCQDQEWLDKMALIAYRSVGSSDLLLGFRPDHVRVEVREGTFLSFDFTVGIYAAALSPDGAYCALLPARVFHYL